MAPPTPSPIPLHVGIEPPCMNVSCTYLKLELAEATHYNVVNECCKVVDGKKNYYILQKKLFYSWFMNTWTVDSDLSLPFCHVFVLTLHTCIFLMSDMHWKYTYAV
jgi:hypothetical protein